MRIICRQVRAAPPPWPPSAVALAVPSHSTMVWYLWYYSRGCGGGWVPTPESEIRKSNSKSDLPVIQNMPYGFGVDTM